RPPRPTLFPYTTLFRSRHCLQGLGPQESRREPAMRALPRRRGGLGYSILWEREPTIRGSRRDGGRIWLIGRPHASCTGTSLRSRSEEHTSELQSRFDLV